MTGHSKKYIELCKKHQGFIRSKMGLVEVGMWTSIITQQGWYNNVIIGEDGFIFLPTLDQMITWVPEGWHLHKLGEILPDPAPKHCYIVEIASAFQDPFLIARTAPTPQQALLKALVELGK